jgi:hypothetical protein
VRVCAAVVKLYRAVRGDVCLEKVYAAVTCGAVHCRGSAGKLSQVVANFDCSRQCSWQCQLSWELSDDDAACAPL